MRRWLPPIAHGLKLPLERRNDLDNWKDGVGMAGTKRVAEPMAVRYSAARLEACAQVKRLCIGAARHLHKWAKSKEGPPGGILWEHLGGCTKSLPILEETGEGEGWASTGPTPAVLTAVPNSVNSDDEDAAESTDTGDTESGSTDEDVDHDDESIQIASTLSWIKAPRGRLIHVLRKSEDVASAGKTPPVQGRALHLRLQHWPNRNS